MSGGRLSSDQMGEGTFSIHVLYELKRHHPLMMLPWVTACSTSTGTGYQDSGLSFSQTGSLPEQPDQTYQMDPVYESADMFRWTQTISYSLPADIIPNSHISPSATYGPLGSTESYRRPYYPSFNPAYHCRSATSNETLLYSSKVAARADLKPEEHKSEGINQDSASGHLHVSLYPAASKLKISIPSASLLKMCC